ncbi:MAG: hypothetical protein UV38_C0003G0223 [candidate division TM6 bacterium GW2011_GWE2_42_60]|nr:MAG: hypothetical protein UV38_C0003G0223 [candidate division TM6 bacterium GW2011_GWE2_42_60]HBY05842.1 hypothetical protein [Candidatus Dependentiae bacterium]
MKFFLKKIFFLVGFFVGFVEAKSGEGFSNTSLARAVGVTAGLDQSVFDERAKPKEKVVKKWTFLVYMAADNDLFPFASQNLAQLKEIGSNENLTILVHLDIKVPGKSKVTKRLLVKKNQIMQIGPDMCLDSGSEETLVSAGLWAINDFPSEHLVIDFWNHGSGDLNPRLRKTINPAFLFRYDPETGMVRLDRSIAFMDFVDLLSKDEQGEPICACDPDRGICFDETYHSYLDDGKLMRGLKRICRARGGKNIDIILFDACLMAGTGTACIMSHFADYMVASEEVVLGPGYNYKLVAGLLARNDMDPESMVKKIVSDYEVVYGKVTGDYTHSAFRLSEFNALNDNIDALAQLLMTALTQQEEQSVRNAIKASRSRYACTYFDEPSYIDLGHFYLNLRDRVSQMRFKSNAEEMKQRILQALTDGLVCMSHLIMANVCGANLAGAHGLSIYFPEYRINNPHHESYQYTEFAQHNRWVDFLKAYHKLV